MGGRRIAALVPLPCILSLIFDMGEQEIKMWGKGGVQWSVGAPGSYEVHFFLRSNVNFRSPFNFVELVVTNLTMVYDL